MSRAEHEVLVEVVANAMCDHVVIDGDKWACAPCREKSVVALALIAQKLETVTPEMGSHGVWLTTLRASPLFPRKDP